MSSIGNVASEPVNNPSDKPIRTRSRFPSLSYHLYNTERFGEYNSCFVMDCVEGDKVPIRSGGRVSSYSLKAPLMQSIFKKKDFYLVPMEAILPLNWQKFYTNPVIGDDVSDDVGTGVKNFWKLAYQIHGALITEVNNVIADNSATPSLLLTAVMRVAIFREYFFSEGSLIKSLGASGFQYSCYTHNNQYVSFDSWFDALMASIVSNVPYFEFACDGHTFGVINNEATDGYRRANSSSVSFRTFVQLMRDDLTVYCSNTGTTTLSTLRAAVKDFFDSTVYGDQTAMNDVDYDLRRLWAYQLTCAHFYSNDHIDYIYSADLYRSLISYFVTLDSSGNYVPKTFTYNGVKYEYDALSAHYFSDMVTKFVSAVSTALVVRNATGVVPDRDRALLGYFSSLLSYRRSLRFVDYFTGSRSRPLAVGNVDVSVNSNLVNVVDISRNIQRQRFFNAVNRFGRKFEEYIKGLSGVKPDFDWHNPVYLAHTQDNVYGVEVENTGAAQQSSANSVTSRLQTNGSRYQFEFEVDRPCVVIGITYYDLPRAYLYATERQLFHMNRFDMFNPFMQFIGDQAVGLPELGRSLTSALNVTFGYQLRHMEYKQRFDQAAGGFVEDLPGYLFTDKQFGNLALINIDSNFIRSLNSELDSFYVSLTGYSLGHYFHFIVDNDNVCDASRPMAFAPSIL